MKIQFVNDAIEIRSGNKFIQIRDLRQVYLVSDMLKCYCDNSPNEKIFHMCVGIFDLFSAARNQFIRHRELQCIKNLWLTHASVPNMQS